jgi:hypothetical protein
MGHMVLDWSATSMARLTVTSRPSQLVGATNPLDLDEAVQGGGL